MSEYQYQPEGADGPNGDYGEDMTEEQAEWSLELIEEALANTAKPDKLSAYERRVALREMKDIIRAALAQSHAEPHDPLVHKYLNSNEELDGTMTQLQCLKKEMKKLLDMSQQLDSLKRDLCVAIAQRWEELEHVASDLLEVRIKAKGEGIPATPHAIATLQAMLEVWSMEAPGAAAVGDPGRLRMLLESCAVPPAILEDLLQHLKAKGPSAVQSTADRVAASLSEYGLILSSLHQLERMPDPNVPDPVTAATTAKGGNGTNGAETGSGGDVPPGLVSTHWERMDAWRGKVTELEGRCRQWEVLSGIPLYVTIGSHYLVRSRDRNETLVAALQRSLKEINSVGC